MTLTSRLDVLLVADQQGIITSCVPASDTVLGWTADELVGQSVNVLIPKPDAGAHDGYMRRYAQTGHTRVLGRARMVEALHKDGQRVSIMLAVTAVPTADGFIYPALIRDLDADRFVDELTRRRDELAVQARVNAIVQRAKAMPELLDGVLSALISMPELAVEQKAGVFLVDDAPGGPDRPGQLPVLGQGGRALRLVHTVGRFSDEFLTKEAWVPLGRCLCGRAAVSGEVLVSAHCDHDPRHDNRFDGMTAHGHYIVPLLADEEVLGVVFLYTAPHPDSSADRVLLLETVGSQIGLAIRRLRAEREMARLALEDALTGALNRRAVLNRLAEERSRAGRKPGPVAVIMVDADHFKGVNDTYGHPAGDAVLVALTARMQTAVRSYDVVGRYGGEEFLVVLPECDLATATLVAERVRAEITGAPIDAGGHQLRITASLGVAATADEAVSDEALIAAADTALYAAKAEGRDRVVACTTGP